MWAAELDLMMWRAVIFILGDDKNRSGNISYVFEHECIIWYTCGYRTGIFGYENINPHLN